MIDGLRLYPFSTEFQSYQDNGGGGGGVIIKVLEEWNMVYD